MDMKQRKPKKTKQELIEYLRDEKGVRFNIMDEAAALAHLSVNNYLRTAAYRKNYGKYTASDYADPSMIGKYKNLDFAYLAELSTVDYHLRRALLQLCIDVEHAIKVWLVEKVTDHINEDGYTVVKDFLRECPTVLDSIEHNCQSTFTSSLINSYFKLCCVFDTTYNPPNISTRVIDHSCPIWVLMELINHGDLIKFITFCNQRKIFANGAASLPACFTNRPYAVLNPIRSLRNACAHNNCLLNSLSSTAGTNPPYEISQYVSKMKIGYPSRRKKLSCRPLFEITCLLYVAEKVLSPTIRDKYAIYFTEMLIARMKRNIKYFEKNSLIISSFEYVLELMEHFARREGK